MTLSLYWSLSNRFTDHFTGKDASLFQILLDLSKSYTDRFVRPWQFHLYIKLIYQMYGIQVTQYIAFSHIFTKLMDGFYMAGWLWIIKAASIVVGNPHLYDVIHNFYQYWYGYHFNTHYLIGATM